MPLVRLQVRNEYGLGTQELYKVGGGGGGENDEDPKAILEGVTVAGLVGILRQLGDLAEFAAEVFHDLQEQVMATASRSHKMIARVHHMEAALPALEKVVLAQKSHIHFAYTDGLEWHPKIQTEKNHLIYTDLPRFIMDSYEECRDPPSFHLLDKFDNGGPGSCLRRYSDPSFFKKALSGSELLTADKVQKEKKGRKSKKMGFRQRNGEVSHAVSISRQNGRMQFASPNMYGQSSAGHTYMRSKSELGDRSTYFDSRTLEIRSTSFDSRAKLGHTECVSDVSSSTRHEDQDHNELPTSRLKLQRNNSDSSLPGKQERDEYDNFTSRSFPEQGVPSSSSVTWDEKTEIVKPTHGQLDKVFKDEKKAPELLPSSSGQSNLENKATILHVDPVDILSDSENISESLSDGNQFDEAGSEPDSYVDALNTMESEIETDVECQTKREVELSSTKLKNKGMECEASTMDKMITQNSASSDTESPTTSISSPNKQITQNISNLVDSEDLVHAQPPQMNGMFSNLDFSVDTGLCRGSRTSDFESTINGPPQINGMPFDPEFSVDTGLSRVSKENDLNSAITGPSSPVSNIRSSESPLGDKIVSRLHEFEESPAKVSVAPSVKFWTNGGLLGLQPSKPPDYSVTNVVNENSMVGTKDDGHPLSSETFIPQSHSNGSVRKLDMLVEMPEHKKENPNSGGVNDRSPDILCSSDLPSDQLVRKTGSTIQNINHSASSMLSHNKQDGAIAKKNAREILSAVSEAKTERSVDSRHSSSNISNIQRPGLTETSVMTHGAGLQVVPDVKIPSSEAGQQNGENASSMLGLNHRLHVNGFGRKLSHGHDDISGAPGSVKSGLMKLQDQYHKQDEQNRVLLQTLPKQNPNKQVRHGSPLNSPPLEHMKISFHPINVFENSSLRLKFPDGHHNHENIKDDMFPSFQLLPELSTSLQDLDYESDDDTFCRSSPYTSEELMSQHSDSNSDQWESGESPESKEHEIYDALRRVSSNESISSPFELDGITYDDFHRDSIRSLDTENGFIPFHDDPSLNFPNFDVVDHLTSKQDMKVDSDLKDLDLVLHYPNEPTPPSLTNEPTPLPLTIEPTPPPPPLPPLQWRIMKQNFPELENEEDAQFKHVDHSHTLEFPGMSPSQELKLAPSKQPYTEEAMPYPPEIKLDQLKLNRNTESNQASNGKDLEEKGDFLHQIRTQSFSLRHTTPVKQTPTPSPTTNTKVSAILEKANAIRQAFVGSDDGGDDENWSDG